MMVRADRKTVDVRVGRWIDRWWIADSWRKGGHGQTDKWLPGGREVAEDAFTHRGIDNWNRVTDGQRLAGPVPGRSLSDSAPGSCSVALSGTWDSKCLHSPSHLCSPGESGHQGEHRRSHSPALVLYLVLCPPGEAPGYKVPNLPQHGYLIPGRTRPRLDWHVPCRRSFSGFQLGCFKGKGQLAGRGARLLRGRR